MFSRTTYSQRRIDDGVELGAVVAEEVQADVPQGTDRGVVGPEGGHPGLALAAPDVVLRGGQLAPDQGVGDDDAEVLPLEGEMLERQRPAVELEDALRPAVDVDELVHDAAADADELVLGLLGQLDQGQAVETEAEEGVEGEGQAAFDRGRRGHAGPDGDVAAEDAVEAADAVARLDELVEDALEVIGPAQRGPVELAELAAEFLIEVAGDELADAVGPGRDGEDDGLVRGPGKDEALVVIGVLADEVDPAGRDDEHGLSREVLAEPFGDDGDERVHDHSLPRDDITRREAEGKDYRAGRDNSTVQTPKLIFCRISAAFCSAGATTSRPNFAARSSGPWKRQKGRTQRYLG